MFYAYLVFTLCASYKRYILFLDENTKFFFLIPFSEEIPIYFYLRQYWTDPRLAGKINLFFSFSGGVITSFWRPFFFCYNARYSNMMVEDFFFNSQLLIHPNENFTFFFFTIKLARRSGYYIFFSYCPDMLIVALSWFFFWMDVGAIGDRLSLGITTILTVMFLLGSINAFLPKVSYAKAIDWYLIVSFIFVFLTLVESMIVFFFLEKDAGDKKNHQVFA
ncbi:gamma-aminobutyric acid receptor subunit rho-2-like [Exaiptasia diaphana]|uniref:Neurotransmitter-gated ion-channel transmembrane domain-containing protein n=1 Tax=Exaiptasia diaphana TaxID=2652724 RepID=A0A913YRH0_EXADI|nr:gamma-aminobutyric acid receptor subunit rho-2-like [Exaiptasia diaphana]